MNDMTARIINTLRTQVSVEKYNSVFAEALEIDNKIEAAIRGPECFDSLDLCDLTVDGERLHDQLEDLAWKLMAEFESAGVKVESNWGIDGDWAIFLSPQNVSHCRTGEYRITSRRTHVINDPA